MDRYETRYRLAPSNRPDGCPVIIEAGALLYDNMTQKCVAQLKLKNTSGNPIQGVWAEVQPLDGDGIVLGEKVSHYYAYESISGSDADSLTSSFGSREPILLDTASAWAISAAVSRVIFPDGSEWTPPTIKAIDFETEMILPELESPDPESSPIEFTKEETDIASTIPLDEASKKSKKPLVIIIAVVCILALILAIIIGIKSKNTTVQVENTGLQIDENTEIVAEEAEQPAEEAKPAAEETENIEEEKMTLEKWLESHEDKARAIKDNFEPKGISSEIKGNALILTQKMEGVIQDENAFVSELEDGFSDDGNAGQAYLTLINTMETVSGISGITIKITIQNSSGKEIYTHEYDVNGTIYSSFDSSSSSSRTLETEINAEQLALIEAFCKDNNLTYSIEGNYLIFTLTYDKYLTESELRLMKTPAEELMVSSMGNAFSSFAGTMETITSISGITIRVRVVDLLDQELCYVDFTSN